ncbi:formamidopyrimidine-DNA glycosylase [Alphaproteobacteria bacterium]|nr:formamidopyrimidine-DNA glycosylase [Alphaproteobacteria bacterium]
MDDGAALLIHLGMSGTIIMGNADAKHDHASFLFENGERATYRDPRRFGMMDLAQQSALTEHPSLARLGPEPLGRDFNATILEKAAQRRRQPVKTALLDQTFVAGLGNIYVCEALFQAGVSPFRPTSSLARAECKKLAAAVKDVLRRAIRAGGSTLKDHRRPSGETGYFQHSFAVYGRTGEPCPRCGGEARIERALQAGRPTFHCPACQR